jgi:hypothetical protein
MRPGVWPTEAHDVIAKHLGNSKYDDVRVWANVIVKNRDVDQFGEFCKRLHQHDQYRDTDFKTVFPEMASYIND